MTDNTSSVKAPLKLQAQALRAQADALEALADALPDASGDGKVYGLDEMAERRNLSANTLRTWAKAGRLRCSSGSRKQYLTTDADVDAALAVEVPARTSLRKTLPEADDGDALEDALRLGELVRGAK